MLKRFVRWFQGLDPEPVECDHVFFPVMEGKKPLGQQCALCGEFNSAESLGLFVQD